jgi:hypothetical protein
MNTDKFVLSSSGWPRKQIACQPVPPQRMDEDGNGRSAFICVHLWLKRQVKGFLPHFKGKMTAFSRIFPLIPAYSRVTGEEGFACRSIKSPIFLPNPSFCHRSMAELQVKPSQTCIIGQDEGRFSANRLT